MNRNYRRDKYLKIIESLKSRVPDMAITTDIIVGFPGETEEDFRMTLEVMDLVQFDNSYSYSFSPRPGTAAAAMPELLSQEEKIERLQILQRKQEQITAARLAAWVGKDVEVLVDNRNQNHEGCLQGRTSQNVMLNFDTPYQGLKIGDIVTARVVAPKRFTLMGELKSHSVV
jgi:tRNA-2-methylthio-N6-dimethylallyladenosine synthase